MCGTTAEFLQIEKDFGVFIIIEINQWMWWFYYSKKSMWRVYEYASGIGETRRGSRFLCIELLQVLKWDVGD